MKKQKPYPGALPITHARLLRDESGRPVRTVGDFCPRGLSRKKLRSLMSQRRAELSSRHLAVRYDRQPGPGKTRKGMIEQLDAMEHDARKYGEEKLQAIARTMLSKLRGLFGKRAETCAVSRRARAKFCSANQTEGATSWEQLTTR